MSKDGTIIGVDVGGRRVGLAISRGNGAVATALRTVDTREEGKHAALDAIIDQCSQRYVSAIVVGWPLRMDGSEGRAVRRVETFIERLEEALEESTVETVPRIRKWDERMTSSEVETALRETEMTRKRRAEVVDKLAATRILQSFLDADGRDRD